VTQLIVDPAQLKVHAAEVRQIAGGVGQASEAAKEEGFGGFDAYGVVCTPIISGALKWFFGDAGALIRNAADLGDAMADGLESNSDVYAGVDDEIQQSMTKLNNDLIS
jgi:hypothetical protein